MSHKGIQRLKESRGMALFVALPCEGKEALEKHVKDFSINPFFFNIFRKMTEKRGSCCWVACPLFGLCTLDGWGSQVKERERLSDLLLEMLGDLEYGFHPFSSKEELFLNQMIALFEGSDAFIPSEKQASWIEALHSRYTEKKKGF